MLCKGNLAAAKELLEVVLDELEMKVVVNSHDSKHILPPYLVSILVFLILKTSKSKLMIKYFLENYKVAKNLTKYRRLIVEGDFESTNHQQTIVKMFT